MGKSFKTIILFLFISDKMDEIEETQKKITGLTMQNTGKL